ncbi:hypothetical protein [Burkholderia multivorans]|uniref:hypothetical protein n=1 Tax=Burkholderia multivorans TaxID=87883 RepID=UPI00209D5A84|nr:hypothetical protein [Burkholderia multivorans]MCO8590308.1 hypothetical protein [Burkholderia multivorans]MCO8632583.1 hypothetical protein [Burkholderia multivorans]MCO8647154.1 hypothetical protein [Burkholderia multivorans]
MNENKQAGRGIHSGMAAAAVALSAAFVLAACGGGSSDSSTTSGATSNATPTAMAGTVAVGGSVIGANITVIDATGKSVATTSDVSGNYSISLSGLTAPLLVVASDPTGVHPTLASVVASIPTGTSAPVVGNVTTLTTAVAALLTTSGNPLELTGSGSLSSLAQTSSVTAAIAKLNTALSNILPANGLTAASFNPVGTAFTANQTGADAVIDAVQVVPAPTGGTQIISSAAPSNGIALNQSTSVSTPLTAPPASAAYLSQVMTALTQCLGGTSSACSNAIDANYKENGFTTFATAHPKIAASGVTIGTPQTIEFFTGTGGVQKALVSIPYTTTGGVAGTEVTVVQQTSGGAWDIIGNQQQYNVNIWSYLSRWQFLDTNDASYNRYEAGLNISIPVGGPNPANLASASVTGPGINGTLYLVPRAASGNSTLALTSAAQTGVPTGGVTSGSNTNLYRWSWQALPGATGTYTPPTGRRGFYAPSPVDLSTVPQFATYTVTFYDSTGAQIGQPMSVVNTTPPISAASGAGVAWQTLATSVQNNFLNPNGSLAGAQPSVGLSWSNLVNNQNIAPLVSRTQIQAVPGTGVTTGEVDGWWPGPATFATSGQYSSTVTAGVDQFGVQQCSGCQFPALQSGGGRLAELTWNVGQTVYYNIWKYID